MKWLKVVDKKPDTDPLSDGSYIYITGKSGDQGAVSASNSAISFTLPAGPTNVKSQGKGSQKIILKKWVHYSFGKKGLWISDEKMEHYQIFCGGFLLFYDDIVRNAVVDHILYLHWEIRKSNPSPDKDNRRLYDAVTIYIDPAPERKGKKYKGVNPRLSIPNVQPPGYGDTVDPPPPPPPPPPRINS